MIRQRGPNYWIVELYDKDAKRKFQVRPTDYGMDEAPKTEQEARDLERDAKKAGSKMIGPMTVRKYHDRFVERAFNHAGHEVTQQTNDHYKDRLKRFVGQYGDTPIAAFTVTEASEFAFDPATRSSAREVKAMFASAKRDGLIDSDPFAGITVQQRKGKPKAFLRKHDVEALVEAARIAHPDWPEFSAFLKWMAWTGMRPSEAAGSQWRFFDQPASMYDVQYQWHSKRHALLAPKHNSTGLIHVFDPAIEAAESVERRGEFMFPGKQGQPMDGPTITNAFKPVKVLAGLPDATPGALRHFLASYMLNELGLQPYTIAQQLRHSDGGKLVTKTYGHPDRAIHLSRIAEAEAAGAFMGQQPDQEASI